MFRLFLLVFFGISESGVSSVLVNDFGICEGGVYLVIVGASSILVGGFDICEGGVSLIIVGDSDMLSGYNWSFCDFVLFFLDCFCRISCCYVVSDGCRCRSGFPLYIILNHLPIIWSSLRKYSITLVQRYALLPVWYLISPSL